MRTSLRAFTLIELILALAASAVIFLAIYGLFGKAVHLRNDATARQRDTGLRARAITRLRNDLRGARISNSTGGLAATLQGSAAAQGSNFPGYLHFTTTTAQSANGALVGDLQEVEYYVLPDENAPDRRTGQLVRTTVTDLLATVRIDPVPQPILAGVTALEVSFFDGQSWLESWEHVEDDTALPEAVRVVLRFGETGAKQVSPPLEIVVPWTTRLLTEPAT